MTNASFATNLQSVSILLSRSGEYLLKCGQALIDALSRLEELGSRKTKAFRQAFKDFCKSLGIDEKNAKLHVNVARTFVHHLFGTLDSATLLKLARPRYKECVAYLHAVANSIPSLRCEQFRAIALQAMAATDTKARFDAKLRRENIKNGKVTRVGNQDNGNFNIRLEMPRTEKSHEILRVLEKKMLVSPLETILWDVVSQTFASTSENTPTVESMPEEIINPTVDVDVDIDVAVEDASEASTIELEEFELDISQPNIAAERAELPTKIKVKQTFDIEPSIVSEDSEIELDEDAVPDLLDLINTKPVDRTILVKVASNHCEHADVGIFPRWYKELDPDALGVIKGYRCNSTHCKKGCRLEEYPGKQSDDVKNLFKSQIERWTNNMRQDLRAIVDYQSQPMSPVVTSMLEMYWHSLKRHEYELLNMAQSWNRVEEVETAIALVYSEFSCVTEVADF